MTSPEELDHWPTWVWFLCETVALRQGMFIGIRSEEQGAPRDPVLLDLPMALAAALSRR